MFFNKKIKEIGGILFKSTIDTFKSFECMYLILMYHSVTKETLKNYHDSAMFVSSKTFEMHIKEISQFFDIVPLESIVEPNQKKRRLCAITFDDGWVDNYENAFPILKKFNVPATIFIPAEVIGAKKRFWFQSIWDIW